MSSSLRRIASNYLVAAGELIANPIVEVDGGGVVRSVGCYDPMLIDRMERTEFYAGVMTAGFVNAHCHLELSYMRGVITPHGGFAAFAGSVAQHRGEASEQQRTEAMVAADNEMSRAGVVAVADILNGSSSFPIKARSDIEYVNFAELFGLRSVDTSAIDPLLSYPSTMATPHSLYSLNDNLLRQVVAMGDVQIPLSIHFMESEAEAELFHRRGDLYEWYQRVGFECDFLHYESPAHRLVSIVPPERSVMLIHNCCVTQYDIDIIMGHFTAPVYWVVCPRSNDFISELLPPVELLRRNNLNICVGTDSLASNHSLSMIEELVALDTSAPIEEQVSWITRNGASALSKNYLGDVRVGMKPAINILSNIDYCKLSLTKGTSVLRVL